MFSCCYFYCSPLSFAKRWCSVLVNSYHPCLILLPHLTLTPAHPPLPLLQTVWCSFTKHLHLMVYRCEKWIISKLRITSLEVLWDYSIDIRELMILSLTVANTLMLNPWSTVLCRTKSGLYCLSVGILRYFRSKLLFDDNIASTLHIFYETSTNRQISMLIPPMPSDCESLNGHRTCWIHWLTVHPGQWMSRSLFFSWEIMSRQFPELQSIISLWRYFTSLVKLFISIQILFYRCCDVSALP